MPWKSRPTPILPVSVLNPVGPGPGGSSTTAGTPSHVPVRVIHCGLLPGVACPEDANMSAPASAEADNSAMLFFRWVRVMRLLGRVGDHGRRVYLLHPRHFRMGAELRSDEPLREDEVRHPAGPRDDEVCGVLAERGPEDGQVDPQRDCGEDERVAVRRPLPVALHIALADAEKGGRRGDDHADPKEQECKVRDGAVRRPP